MNGLEEHARGRLQWRWSIAIHRTAPSYCSFS